MYIAKRGIILWLDLKDVLLHLLCCTLWINHQGPSSRVGHNYSIVNGERVHWQSSNVPGSDLDWFS